LIKRQSLLQHLKHIKLATLYLSSWHCGVVVVAATGAAVADVVAAGIGCAVAAVFAGVGGAGSAAVARVRPVRFFLRSG
jgi:hypothetical protein